jgi:hypothetical protein
VAAKEINSNVIGKGRLMQCNKPKKVAFISSYSTAQEGINPCALRLLENVDTALVPFQPVLIAIQPDEQLNNLSTVQFVIRRDIRSDYQEAADFINSGNIEAVSLQYECGLYGGQAGSYIIPLIRRVNAPVISTLFSVLEEPSSESYKTLVNICDFSHKVIVLNRCYFEMLRDLYGVTAGKIEVIPLNQ